MGGYKLHDKLSFLSHQILAYSYLRYTKARTKPAKINFCISIIAIINRLRKPTRPPIRRWLLMEIPRDPPSARRLRGSALPALRAFRMAGRGVASRLAPLVLGATLPATPVRVRFSAVPFVRAGVPAVVVAVIVVVVSIIRAVFIAVSVAVVVAIIAAAPIAGGVDALHAPFTLRETILVGKAFLLVLTELSLVFVFLGHELLFSSAVLAVPATSSAAFVCGVFAGIDIVVVAVEGGFDFVAAVIEDGGVAAVAELLMASRRLVDPGPWVRQMLRRGPPCGVKCRIGRMLCLLIAVDVVKRGFDILVDRAAEDGSPARAG